MGKISLLPQASPETGTVVAVAGKVRDSGVCKLTYLGRQIAGVIL